MLPFSPIAGDTPLISAEISIEVMLFRLVLAAILAASISYRPWRLLMKNTARVACDTAQAQVIIAVAPCSPARA